MRGEIDLRCERLGYALAVLLHSCALAQVEPGPNGCSRQQRGEKKQGKPVHNAEDPERGESQSERIYANNKNASELSRYWYDGQRTQAQVSPR